MTHKMTNEEIKTVYEKAGGPPIVHEYNEDGRPASLRDYIGDILLMLAALGAAAFVCLVVF
jgi:hypothetical protein